MSDDDTIPLISEEDEEMEELHTFASSTDNSESQPERTDDEIQLQHQFHYFPPSDDIIEEEEIQVGLPTRPGKPAIVLMGCCPCLSNNPCSDDKKLEYKSIPKTTVFFLSVIQIGLFILSIFIGGFAPLYENWMIGPSGETLVGMGAKYGPLIRYKFEVWRLISPVFLHAGIIQLVVNIFYQLRMGLYLEPRWGWAKFVIVYFTSGFAGVALSCVTNPNSVSVAASFSMIGIMGAWFSQLHMTWESMEGWQKKMNLTVCLVVILITIGEGLGPSYVDTAGHIGGLLMGTALGYLFFGWNNATFHQDKLLARVILLAGSLFVLLYSFVTMGLFYTMISVDPLPEQESMDDEYIMSNSTIIDTYAFISTYSSTSSYFGISSLTTSSPEVPTSYK